VWQFSNSHLAFCKGAAFVERLVGKQIAFSVRCDHHATAVAARTRYYPKRGKWGITVMMACLAQRDRPLGLMPFDWLLLFTGTMLGGLIVLLA
jgi:hypothetical protein